VKRYGKYGGKLLCDISFLRLVIYHNIFNYREEEGEGGRRKEEEVFLGVIKKSQQNTVGENHY